MKSAKDLWLIIGGFCIGVINGLLGAGGGMLAVPLLKSVGLSTKEAHANSLVVILPLSIFSAILYLVYGRVALMDALPFIPAGLIGAFLGTVLLKKVPDAWIRRIFALFIIWAGVKILT
ncbi:MAG: sulfite exporter TauE/SafE family protein [Oscillospiraceae bacterium]